MVIFVVVSRKRAWEHDTCAWPVDLMVFVEKNNIFGWHIYIYTLFKAQTSERDVY